ncbi:hypothetical protein LCGC14_1965560 [marine sediment metagenome]
MTKEIIIHTDGACSGNGTDNAQGGWAAILTNDTKQLCISGGVPDTTNQRMELQAAIEGLKAVKNIDTPITLFTDSMYLINGCSKWLEKWKANDWKLSKGKPVKNVDLWQELDTIQSKLTVTYVWVKGHNGDPMNERADRLATKAIGQPNKRQVHTK